MPELDVDFHDPRISMTHWYPQVEHLSVPTPQTEFCNITNQSSLKKRKENELSVTSMEEILKQIPVQDIQESISNLPTDKAHIRSDWKSTILEEGGQLTQEPKNIHHNVVELINSMYMQGFPKFCLVIREWIDINSFGTTYNKMLAPEVRFIVDNGEIKGHFMDIYPQDFDRSYSDKEAESILQEMESEVEQSSDKLHSWAKLIAEELDESGWSIDFIQDTNGNWFMTDMSLYGLYWNEREDEWHNISYIPPNKPYNLEKNVPDELPSEK